MKKTDPSSENNTISDEDRALFSDTIGQVRPIRSDRVIPERKKPEARPVQHLKDEQSVMDELMTHEIDPEVMVTGEELLFRRPGLQNRVIRRLQQGRYRVQDELDLHHMNAEAARKSIDYFIEQSLKSGIGCVLIIHGKGLRSKNTGPVLKDLTASMLRRMKPVMAFCSARSIDGGTGAVYVLLHQRKISTID